MKNFCLIVGLSLSLVTVSLSCTAGIGQTQALSTTGPNSSKSIGSNRPQRVFYLSSFGADFPWTTDQFEGFKSGLADLTVNYQSYALDVKRHNDAESLAQTSAAAKAAILAFQPDLVYLSDDAAQKLVGQDLARAGLNLVFSGVNQTAATYHYDQSPVVTGVLEREHFVESVSLLRQVVPTVKKIAVIFDGDDQNWSRLRLAMEQEAATMSGVSFPVWINTRSYATFQDEVANQLPGQVDAICLVGIFTFQDAAGQNVPYESVCQWVVEHSKLPDFSFWSDRVYHGTLLSVFIDGLAHGLAAGRLAHQILADGVQPSQIPVVDSSKGSAMINSKRAKQLGINLSSSLLLNCTVIDKYSWDHNGAR